MAQHTAWCRLAVATTACCHRSRYADLGGAIGAPASLGTIAAAWYLPPASKLFATPPATSGTATSAWYALALVAFAVTCLALRDQWPRYALRARPSSWCRTGSGRPSSCGRGNRLGDPGIGASP